MRDFYQGIFVGILFLLGLVGGFMIVKFEKENSGWDNKMTIEYRSQKEFDRDLIRNLVNKSEITTNFVNREIIMDKHFIRYVLTNPETKK